jgi:hypothetical protein
VESVPPITLHDPVFRPHSEILGQSQRNSFGAAVRQQQVVTFVTDGIGIAHVCNIFTAEKYYNFFKAAGYETD